MSDLHSHTGQPLQPQPSRFVSLRWRLTSMLGFVLLCTLFVISAIVTTYVRNTEANTLYERQSETALAIETEVTHLHQQISTMLTLISTFRLDVLESDPTILHNILQNNPAVAEVAYFNTRGDVIAQASLDDLLLLTEAHTTVDVHGDALVEQSIVAREWFLATRQGENYFDVAHFAPQLESGYRQQYLLFAMPASSQSVIAARVNVGELRRIVVDARFRDRGDIYLANREGAVVVHSGQAILAPQFTIREQPEFQAATAARTHWSGVYRNWRDTRVFGLIMPIDGINWFVITEVSSWDAYATTRRAYTILGGGMLAFVILMMWVSAEWMEGLILTPIERLRDGAERIGQGDLQHHIELQQEDEIGQVAAAFNQMSAELQELYNELERKIAERTAQLEEQKQELARSNAELAQFAYIASHDLQEPLRMITNYLQLIEQRYQGQLDEDADEFIRYATDGARRMQQLIRDLLAYSRVGTQEQNFQQVDLHQLVEQLLEDFQLVVAEKKVHMVIGQLPCVWGDVIQLGQLFRNLLANALKFSDQPAPTVELSAHYDASTNEWVFAVRDEGIGIAPAHHERIFLIFQRLHTRSEYPGTGIGLALCKKIVERHGGRIWVDSAENAGAIFFFTLPNHRQS